MCVCIDVLEEDKFNVELVVQCVRMSDMPQTHHHALLLLGALAGIFPEKVLHNIMPIFTFMGSNIMRLDDTYSFQVINKTVQAVIPALIKVCLKICLLYVLFNIFKAFECLLFIRASKIKKKKKTKIYSIKCL